MRSVAVKKVLIFFSAGVGDSILLVPLVNELKKQDYQVIGLFTSPFHCESIFKNTDLFDGIEIRKNKFSLFLFSILHYKNYDKVFLNHFSFSRSHIKLATFLGKNIFTNYISSVSLPNSVQIIKPLPDKHDALQNVFLFDKTISLPDLNFTINYKSHNENHFNLPEKYIVVQVSAANNKAPYKNWPLNNWLQLFKNLKVTLPNTQLVVLGDETETLLNEQLSNIGIISLIGKTQLSEVMEIISRSQFYIGLDSGLMHMAVALNKQTFTIWGASNPTLYGYEWMGETHKVVSLYLSCAPCSAWINPNTSRVTDPLTCPDFKCIKTLSVERVTTELNGFIKTIGVS
ncbi:MAG: glycosyltransferase family 9 protein [Burkholderiales bacterium]|nr:glycosyltransferase family 9 protein [Bacteroidia bacterium]